MTTDSLTTQSEADTPLKSPSAGSGESEDGNRERHLRRADLRAGVLLILLALGMLYEAGSFPLQDSYGGVQNAWYVSPALMPLIVGGSLLALALVLTGNAIVYARSSGGTLKLLREPSDQTREYRLRLGAVVLFFSSYVYGLIPHVDFLIATLFFLCVFVVTFYLDLPALLRFNALFLPVSSIAIFMLGTSAFLDQYLYFANDIVAGVFLVLFLLLNLRFVWHQPGARPKFRRALLVSGLVSLIICGTFKYALLVPLPTEGAAIRALDQLQALTRSPKD